MISNFKQRKLNVALVATFAIIGVGFGADSYAIGGVTANMTVSATVEASCTLITSDLDFGSVDPGVGSSSSAGINVYCVGNDTPTVVTLGQGLNDTAGSPAVPARNMSNGVYTLRYNLYQDESHTVLWGNTIATGVAVLGNGDGPSLQVYGLIPGNQEVGLGSYSDTVVATVNF